MYRERGLDRSAGDRWVDERETGHAGFAELRLAVHW
jgi:hypothetical protein